MRFIYFATAGARLYLRSRRSAKCVSRPPLTGEQRRRTQLDITRCLLARQQVAATRLKHFLSSAARAEAAEVYGRRRRASIFDDADAPCRARPTGVATRRVWRFRALITPRAPRPAAAMMPDADVSRDRSFFASVPSSARQAAGFRCGKRLRWARRRAPRRRAWPSPRGRRDAAEQCRAEPRGKAMRRPPPRVTATIAVRARRQTFSRRKKWRRRGPAKAWPCLYYMRAARRRRR